MKVQPLQLPHYVSETIHILERWHLIRKSGARRGRKVDYLDYGSGLGWDVVALEEAGVRAHAYDPVYYPDDPPPADIVHVKLAEEIEKAWDLAQVLLVSDPSVDLSALGTVVELGPGLIGVPRNRERFIRHVLDLGATAA